MMGMLGNIVGSRRLGMELEVVVGLLEVLVGLVVLGDLVVLEDLVVRYLLLVLGFLVVRLVLGVRVEVELRNMLGDMQEHRRQGMLLRKMLDVFDACLYVSFLLRCIRSLPKGII